mmetsp:Transcript_20995/g.59066  ORF Transcript_20995/g.59066 Transcript_20995/m.59066 type:complete len:232 (+) Transcript_20995:821-1516(+)
MRVPPDGNLVHLILILLATAKQCQRQTGLHEGLAVDAGAHRVHNEAEQVGFPCNRLDCQQVLRGLRYVVGIKVLAHRAPVVHERDSVQVEQEDALVRLLAALYVRAHHADDAAHGDSVPGYARVHEVVAQLHLDGSGHASRLGEVTLHSLLDPQHLPVLRHRGAPDRDEHAALAGRRTRHGRLILAVLELQALATAALVAVELQGQHDRPHLAHADHRTADAYEFVHIKGL